MRYIKYSVLILVCLATFFASSITLAQQGNSENGINQAIRSVEKQTGGRVLSAEKRRIDGQASYRLKVLTPSGHVRIIHIDAD